MVESALEETLASVLAREWWSLLLRGVVAIAFGIATLVWPGISLATLVLLFGAFALVDGVLGTLSAIRHRRERENWGLLLLGGLLGIGVGVLTLVNPAITAMALLFYIAIWAVSTGVLEIVAAIKLRRHIRGEWMMILAGLASVGFGAILVLRPAVGALAMAGLIAAWAIVFGGALVGLAFRVRRFAKTLPARSTAPAPQVA